jgi:hypothetical protein
MHGVGPTMDDLVAVGLQGPRGGVAAGADGGHRPVAGRKRASLALWHPVVGGNEHPGESLDKRLAVELARRGRPAKSVSSLGLRGSSDSDLALGSRR